MSDSSIPNNQSTHTETAAETTAAVVSARHAEQAAGRADNARAEERLQARLQEQSEWRRSNTLLCDCSNCINARELKKETGLGGESAGRRQPTLALAKQPDIRQRWPTSDIRSLFRFLLPSDESDETIATSHIYS